MTDFQNFIGNFVKEITVMRNHDHNAFKPVQIILQPGYHLVIQMVGRLIQNQHIRRVYQSSGQSYTLLLATRKLLHRDIMFCNPQLIQNISGLAFCAPVLLPFPISHIVLYNGTFWKIRHLRQIGDTKAILGNHLSLICLLFPCNDFQQSTFSSSIDSNDSDFIPIMDSIGNIIKNLFISKNLAYMFNVQYIHKNHNSFFTIHWHLFQYFPPLSVSFFLKTMDPV